MITTFRRVSAFGLALLLCALCAIPVAALESKVIDGKTYTCVNTKADYTAVVNTMLKNHENFSNVYYIEGKEEWDSAFSNDGRNFTGHGKRFYYSSYAEYNPDSVSITAHRHAIYDEQNCFQGFTEESYGYIEIRYADDKDELAKADAKIKSILSGIASKTDVEKIRYIANYICNTTQYGSQKLEDGGYDQINGVYDVLHGIRTNTVCTSYALTFQRFMELAGIKSCLLSNIGHVWNMVYLDGLWYGVDVTGMDDKEKINNNYLLMGYDKLKGFDLEKNTPVAEFKKTNRIAPTQYGAGTTGKKPASTTSVAAGTTTTGGKKPAGTTTSAVAQPGESTTVTEGATSTTTTLPVEDEVTVESIDLSEETLVDTTVFENAAQNGTTLSMEGEAYSWRFDGKKLDTDKLSADFDATVTVGDAVPQEQTAQITKAAGNTPVYPFTFAHHGELPGEAEVSITVDTQYVGKQMYIYYLNEEGIPVEVGREEVSGDARLSFTTDHCSLWFLSEERIENSIVEENAPPVLWIVLAAVLVVAVGVGIFLLIKAKRRTNNV